MQADPMFPRMSELPATFFAKLTPSSPINPVCALVAFLAAESGDHQLHVRSVTISRADYAVLLGLLKTWLTVRLQPPDAVDKFELPCVDARVPRGYALLATAASAKKAV